MIIDDANGTPTSKKINLGQLFGALPSNTVHAGTVRFNANTRFLASNTIITANVNMNTSGLFKVNNAIVTVRSNPSTNNASTESLKVGHIFFSNTHLYLAVNATTIKRVALSVF